MSFGAEVARRIRSLAKDPWIGDWVVTNLPLLNVEESETPCEVFYLPENFEGFSISIYPDQRKLAISGGLEGTEGHFMAVQDMREARVLAYPDAYITLLIEPDSFTRVNKRREPLITASERARLWSHSGLVDLIVMLPEHDDRNLSERYQKIHSAIQPVLWCANIENPYFLEINRRGNTELQYIDLIRLFRHGVLPSTSLLASILSRSIEDSIELIKQEAKKIGYSKGIYRLADTLHTEQRERIAFSILTQGLIQTFE